jgi:hypothetical protein
VNLTSDVAHVGTVMKHVLEELKTHNTNFHGRPLLIFGPADDAADANAPAIYWMPIKEDTSPPTRQGKPGSPGSLWTRVVQVSLVLFGGIIEGAYSDDEATYRDCDLTEELLSKLANAVHRNLSQWSYDIESTSWVPGGRTGIGMSCEVLLTVKLPLVREDNPTVTPVAIEAETQIDT